MISAFDLSGINSVLKRAYNKADWSLEDYREEYEFSQRMLSERLDRILALEVQLRAAKTRARNLRRKLKAAE